MKRRYILLIFLIVSSCIPIKFAPEIKDYRIAVAKRFKRDLPKHYAFIFEDSKNADEFYRFLFWKLGSTDVDIEVNLPFKVEDKTYYMTFHERSKRSVTLNLLPIFIDVALERNGMDPSLEEMYESGDESWYILITVMDSEFRDCLKPSYPQQKEVVATLAALKEEYMNTHHYVEAFLKQG